MFRAITVIAAIIALAVSAAPASAGLLSSPLGLTTKPKPVTTQSGYDTITLNERAPTPRTLGAANDVSQLSLRKARPRRAVIVLIGANDYGLLLDAVGKELGK